MNELRRRNVCRAVVAYWVVAWTCIEVSSVVEQALMLPEWLDQMVIIFCVAGLPIVVSVSWIFEWEPSGLVAHDRELRHSRTGDHQHEFASRIADEVYRRLVDDLDVKIL